MKSLDWAKQHQLLVGASLLAAAAAILLVAQRRVALIGDSYAVGLGPYLQKLISNFRYEGHVGSSTGQWAAGQYGGWLVWYRPSIVLVSLGVNDGSSPNRANYQAIASRIQSLGAKIFWIEPPANVDSASKAIIDSIGVATIPPMWMPLSPDNLHPQNYYPWAVEVAQEVA